MVTQVRSFNRLVTQRVGALDDRFLGRDRPLGEARVLWEIGADGCDVRLLRARLGVDSGYLSRLLRSLERPGSSRSGASDHDRRVRTARSRRRASPSATSSNGAATSSRTRSSSRSASRSASGSWRRSPRRSGCSASLSSASASSTRCTATRSTACRPTRASSTAALGGSAHAWPAIFASLDQLRPPRGIFVVAALHAEPIGCGGLKLPPGEPAEVKRMWVSESARGLGLGRRLLGELERRAAEAGATSIRLETNGALTEAIALYRSSGYEEIEPFNDEPYAHHWFGKRLTAGPEPPSRLRARGERYQRELRPRRLV